MSMTEHRTKQYILKAVRGGYVTSPPVKRSIFADIAIRNGGHGDESLTRETSNPDINGFCWHDLDIARTTLSS